MRTKKSIALVMSIFLTAGMAAGCGNNTTTSENNSSTDAAVTDKNSEDTTKNKADTTASSSTGEVKIAWYAPAPHPYFDEVKKGVEKFKEEQNMDVTIQVGPDWTQASENENVEALVAQGINAISIYPCDSSGANGLYKEIKEKMGVNIINFGTDTQHPTDASFAVATDVKQAAMDATEALIKMMGEKGNIINVLEVLEDPNTALRKQGIEEVVAKYPNVKIIQEIAGIKTQEEAVTKIESAISSQMGQVNGIICTGQVTSVGMTQTLGDYYAKNKDAAHISAIAIDTDDGVIKAIKNGVIDATIAQNPIGHGYLSCMILKYMGEGYTPKADAYMINAGNVLVTKDNLDTYADGLEKVTQQIADELTTKYLEKK